MQSILKANQQGLNVILITLFLFYLQVIVIISILFIVLSTIALTLNTVPSLRIREYFSINLHAIYWICFRAVLYT